MLAGVLLPIIVTLIKLKRLVLVATKPALNQIQNTHLMALLFRG